MNTLISRENNFEYLTKIIALLLHEDFTSTPENISKALKVPIEQTRQDFIALLSISKLSNALYPKDDSVEFEISNTELWHRQILSGFFDHIEFCMDSNALYFNINSTSESESSDKKIPFWLRHIEFLQLKTHYPDLFKTSPSKSEVRIKAPNPAYNQTTKAIIEYADTLNAAIEYDESVSFTYMLPQTEVSSTVQSIHSSRNRIETTIYPQYLYHDTDKNLIYCIGLEIEQPDKISSGISQDDISCKIFRLDRIHEFNRSKAPALHNLPGNVQQQLEDMRQKLDYMWGMSSFDEEPVPVKVRIYANTANIISKIKAETSLRKYGKLTQDGNDYIYTDTIIGTANFRSWLRGYGSSVVVMEPKELADEMKESALKVIQLYAGADNCQDS